MINIFHLLRMSVSGLVKGRTLDSDRLNEHIAKRFYVKNGELTVLQQKTHTLFTKTFEFYPALKEALDNFQLDYEVSLGYEMKSSNYKPFDYYQPYNKACYVYINEANQYALHFIPKLNITIHFPKITIQNRERKQHIINDLFVKFSVNIYNKLEILYGTRTTFSPVESEKKYRHSHLSAYSSLQFSKFCLGHEAPISFTQVLLEEALSKYNENWSELFLFFLNQIKAFVSYESLEGGPYIKIASLVPNNYTEVDKIGILQLDNAYSKLLNAFTNQYSEVLFVFIKNNNLFYANKVYDIKQEVFDRVLFTDDLLKSHYLDNTFKGNYLLYTYNNAPIKFDTVLNNTHTDLDEYVLFQGKKIHGIIKTETNFDNPDDIKINVKQILKNYAYNKFRSEINSHKV